MIKLKLASEDGKKIEVQDDIFAELPEFENNIEAGGAVIDWQEMSCSFILSDKADFNGNDREKLRALFDNAKESVSCKIYVNGFIRFRGWARIKDGDISYDYTGKTLDVDFYGYDYSDPYFCPFEGLKKIEHPDFKEVVKYCFSRSSLDVFCVPETWIFKEKLKLYVEDSDKYDVDRSLFCVNFTEVGQKELFAELTALTDTYLFISGRTANFIGKKPQNPTEILNLNVAPLSLSVETIAPFSNDLTAVSLKLREPRRFLYINIEDNEPLPGINQQVKVNGLEFIVTRREERGYIDHETGMYYGHRIFIRRGECSDLPPKGKFSSDTLSDRDYARLGELKKYKEFTSEELTTFLKSVYPEETARKIKEYACFLPASVKIGNFFEDRDGDIMQIIKIKRNTAQLNKPEQWTEFTGVETCFI